MVKKLKKGFTLAELLIVVAIIAVLTAIAVPLFVGAVNKADDATKAANQRAVRGAAVVYILEESAKGKPSDAITTNGQKSGVWTASKQGEDAGTWELTGPWYATATLDKSGNIKEGSITITTDTTEEAYTDNGKEITITVKVEKLTYTATAS